MENNEVKEIARMQQLIDTYELHIRSVAIIIRTCGQIELNYPIMNRTPLDKEMNRTPLDKEMNETWNFVKTYIKEGKG